jgi:hypothetical protein
VDEGASSALIHAAPRNLEKFVISLKILDLEVAPQWARLVSDGLRHSPPRQSEGPVSVYDQQLELSACTQHGTVTLTSDLSSVIMACGRACLD